MYYNKVYDFLNIPHIHADYSLEFETEDKSTINPVLYDRLKQFFRSDVNNLEKYLNIKTNWL
jgi:hypothetical protein